MFGKSDVIPGRRLTLGITLTYVSLFLFIPLAAFMLYASGMGFEKFFAAVTDWRNVHAYGVSFFCALTAGIINALFGLIIAWGLVRYDFRGKKIMDALIDLPFAISPVVAGLFFIMLFGRMSPLYPLLQEYNLAIVFAVPGIILATVFVTFPFITRELVPVMESQGRSEEEAAATMGTNGWTIFRRVTLPNIKWALGYGIVLCSARALGEFGAVSVVSGHIRGKTNTLPLHIEILYNEYNFTAAFAVASVLVLLAIIILILRNLIENAGKASLQVSNLKAGVAND